jgi:hypothetical protein
VKNDSLKNNEVRLVKIYCFIQLNKYEDALKEMDSSIPEQLVLSERAYCYYKLNCLKDSLELVQKMQNEHIHPEMATKLEAQIVSS